MTLGVFSLHTHTAYFPLCSSHVERERGKREEKENATERILRVAKVTDYSGTRLKRGSYGVPQRGANGGHTLQGIRVPRRSMLTAHEGNAELLW